MISHRKNLWLFCNITYKTRIVCATPEKAVEEMYNKAVSIGANAVINLTIKPMVNSKLGIIDGYSASGMAIKK